MPTFSLFYFGRLRIWVCWLFLIVGCDGPAEWTPSFYFSRYPVHHPLDLTKVLGREVRLVSKQDTLDLRIHHEFSTGLNLLTDATSGDTLQRAWITRHRGLYYFTWPISDTCYWVHAVRIKRNQVQGLADAYHQLRFIEQVARAGQFPDLVQHYDSTTDILRLRFEPKRLRKFYAVMLDSLPIYRMMPRIHHQYAFIHTDSISTIAQNPEPFFHSMYPNPASDILTLRVASKRPCEATIFDMEGRLIQTTPVSAATITVQVQHLPAGCYIVRVQETTTGRSAVQQLQVEH